MSLTSYQAAPPCNKREGETMLCQWGVSTAFLKFIVLAARQPRHRTPRGPAPPSLSAKIATHDIARLSGQRVLAKTETTGDNANGGFPKRATLPSREEDST